MWRFPILPRVDLITNPELVSTVRMAATTESRIERLSSAAAKRVIEPDVDLPGSVGDGQLLPDDLLSVHGLDLDLTAEQRRILGREEVAAMLRSGIAFEAMLNAGFSLQIVRSPDLTDPRITFLLHEIGEETRHQRVFQRILRQIGSRAEMPTLPLHMRLLDRVGPHLLMAHPALLTTLVLAGEEIPDLLQKLASEHPDTDPFLAEVNRYHRAEEARHLSYARAVLPETWASATRLDRWAVRHAAPWVVGDMFRLLTVPDSYAAAGLPGQATWEAVQANPARLAIRHQAVRPVLATLIEAGVFGSAGVPKGWRQLCDVDRNGAPRS